MCQKYFPLKCSELKYLYWKLKKTSKMIALKLNISESSVWMMIKECDLSKKKYKIKKRGRKGYKMPESEKAKHRIQPHAKKVVKINPYTFEILKTYRSISAVEEDGYNRENVRRAVKTAGVHKDYLWAYNGLEEGTIRVAQKRNIEKKMKILNIKKPTKKELENMYLKDNMTLKNIAKIFDVSMGCIAKQIKKYNLYKRKELPFFTKDIFIKELKKGMSISKIAEKYKRKRSSIMTYKSRWKIRS